MDDNKIIKIAAIGFVGLVVAPAVIGGVLQLGALAIDGVNNLINQRAYDKKIKDGLKNGSIIEVDGKYYEVTEDEA